MLCRGMDVPRLLQWQDSLPTLWACPPCLGVPAAGCPWLPWELPFLWWVQEGSTQLPTSQNVWLPPNFLKDKSSSEE